MRDISWKNYVTVRINPRNFEQFANACAAENFVLKDVQKENGFFYCTMTFADFKQIRPIVRKTDVKIKIVQKKGATYFLHIHRRRYGFYLGAFFAVCLFIYLTSCIWVVEVTGNKTTKEKDILKIMSKNGIAVGEWRYGKKISDIKNDALIDLDTLSWLWVTIDGTRAIVEVREKGESTDIVDKSKPCNLVADYPGVIYDMQVKSGRKVVERGKTVAKGELLVSGITETAYRQNRYIYSSGTVTARTWRTMEADYGNTEIIKKATGNKKKMWRISILGKDFKLYWSNRMGFKEYDIKSKIKNVKLFKNIYLPITFTTEEFCEIITEEKTLDKETVISRAVAERTDKIKSQCPEGTVTLGRTYGYDTPADGKIHVTVTVESLENIARQVGIEVEKAEDNIIGENN